MAEVLDVDHRPPDPTRPLVCLDEPSQQRTKAGRLSLPPLPGAPTRCDPADERHGVANLFLLSAPPLGWRHVKVTPQRTKRDWAHLIQALGDVHFPTAERIILGLDNLNPHPPAVLDEALAPAEATRLWDKLEIHYPPKHGRWLNMAEIELSALGRHCLDQRIPDQVALTEEVVAWEEERNAAHVTVNWQFTAADARIKLKHLYPIREPAK